MPKRKSCLICWRESFLTITSRLLLTKHETYGKVIIKLYDAIQNKVVGNFELAYGDRSRCNEHYRNVVFNHFACHCCTSVACLGFLRCAFSC